LEKRRPESSTADTSLPWRRIDRPEARQGTVVLGAAEALEDFLPASFQGGLQVGFRIRYRYRYIIA
jgi:hypothetical protein